MSNWEIIVPVNRKKKISTANDDSLMIGDNLRENIQVPPARRVDCSLLPLGAFTEEPTDFDPTLRERSFAHILELDEQRDSLRDMHNVMEETNPAFSAQQRMEAYVSLDPSSYTPLAMERDIGLDREVEYTLLANKQDEESEQICYEPEETEIDHAPEGFDTFDEYQAKVQPLLQLPSDLEALVLEYLDFDALDRLHQVIVTVQRVFEEVSYYYTDCKKLGEQWPAITEEAMKEKKDADEMEAVLKRPESKEQESEAQEDDDDDAIDPHVAQSKLRSHPMFYHLSPYTRKILLEFAAKAATVGVQLITNGSNGFVEEPFEASGELSSKYLAHVQESLSDELDAWLELHEELDQQRDLAMEEIYFAQNVVELVQCVFALPSSGIFVNENELYEVKDISEYNDVQEGTKPKSIEQNDENMDTEAQATSAAAANLTSFAESSSSSSSSSSSNPRKRSREGEEPAAAAALSSSASSSLPAPTTSALDTPMAVSEDIDVLQSITSTSYEQIIDDHPELLTTTNAVDRIAHIDKKLRYSFAMSVEDSESEEESEETLASRRGCVLRDPDYHEKEQERRSKLTDAQRKAEDDHDPNSDDEEPYFYPLASTVWRRRMTSEKYEAAWVCLEYYNNLQKLLSLYDQGDENDRLLMSSIDEVKEWTEKLRISVSHYYLLHMNRSLNDDRYLSSLNQLAQVRIEQAVSKDLVFNKQSFEYLVEEISRDTHFDIKWSAEALEALQTESENFLTTRLENANIAMVHAKVESSFDFAHRSRKEEDQRRQRRRDHRWESDDEDGDDLSAHKDPAYRLAIAPRDLQLARRLDQSDDY